jgi:5-formyltetrahydrofolate cyclo-ligase
MIKAKKRKIKKKYLKIRDNISLQRKDLASKNANDYLKEILIDYKNVLSFASMTNEIDLWPINSHLTSKKSLRLPRVKKDVLEAYSVSNLKNLTTSIYKILEPNIKNDGKINPLYIDCILVPGVVFNKNGYRLGYGKGFYDKFLKSLNHKPKIIGICFKEQYIVDDLPIEDHDFRIDEILFF